MDHVDDLTRAAARFNLEAGVTGVLLYDGHRFLQYIEGPEDSINVVYGRILGARSHCELLELGRGRVSGRFFPTGRCGCSGLSLPTSATWPVATGVGSPAVAPCAS
ncbi:BLUF domain-containing protein [Stenotrophomonas maltophilia]|uniref:BLUF domain-containing protein n=1 Tax=Stenotrophomonas maltophilia group TaxID=995085 RepID=UPI001E302977|nr:BLUF domain-containing protein [Stenotrophomonas maltophilia]